MAPFGEGLGYDWAIQETAKCIEELVEMIRPHQECAAASQFNFSRKEWLPPSITISSHLLKRADAALYQAKESGRDRVVAAAAFEGGEPLGTAAVERARCRRRAVVGIDAARQAARRLDHDTIKFNRTAI